MPKNGGEETPRSTRKAQTNGGTSGDRVNSRELGIYVADACETEVSDFGLWACLRFFPCLIAIEMFRAQLAGGLTVLIRIGARRARGGMGGAFLAEPSCGTDTSRRSIPWLAACSASIANKSWGAIASWGCVPCARAIFARRARHAILGPGLALQHKGSVDSALWRG